MEAISENLSKLAKKWLFIRIFPFFFNHYYCENENNVDFSEKLMKLMHMPNMIFGQPAWQVMRPSRSCKCAMENDDALWVQIQQLLATHVM